MNLSEFVAHYEKRQVKNLGTLEIPYLKIFNFFSNFFMKAIDNIVAGC